MFYAVSTIFRPYNGGGSVELSEPNRYIYFCEIIFIRVLLYQMLPSCVGKLYYNILNVYSIKHVVYIYVCFQNNPRQLNISECISNFSYWIAQMRSVGSYSEPCVIEFCAIDFFRSIFTFVKAYHPLPSSVTG